MNRHTSPVLTVIMILMKMKRLLLLLSALGWCANQACATDALQIRVWNFTGHEFGQCGNNNAINNICLMGPGFGEYVNNAGGTQPGTYFVLPNAANTFYGLGFYTLTHRCFPTWQSHVVATGLFAGGTQTWDWFVFDDGCPECSPYPVTAIDDNSDGGEDDCDQPCSGMPVWSVSEPYVSLWLHDEPLGYQPALGPRVSFKLAYKQRESASGLDTNIFSVGQKWNCNWLSYVAQDANGSNVIHFAGGRQRTSYGTNDYLTNTRLTGDTTNGFTLSYPDGSSEVFGFVVTSDSGAFRKAFLTERATPQGQKLRFGYQPYAPSNPVIRLQSVTDADGHTNFVYYNATNSYSTNLISQVVDPFGRSCWLAYDSLGRLTNITDAAGISSSFAYSADNWVTNLTTPYGTTAFAITGVDFIPYGRSILVTEPDSSKQLFLYMDSALGIASTNATGETPDLASFGNSMETTGLNLRNSFHWGRRQYSALPTGFLASVIWLN